MRGILIKLLSFSMVSFYLINPYSVMAISSELKQELNNDYIPSSGGSAGAPPGSSSNGNIIVAPPNYPDPYGDIVVTIGGSTTTVIVEDNGDGVIDLMDLIRLKKKENDSFSMSLFLDWIYGKKASDL